MSQRVGPQLSKSRFLGGLQCLKRLYLECYHRDLADEVGSGQQGLFDSGTAVGELARQRFPNGLLIQEDHLHHSDAVKSTARAIADDTVPAIFEAAFTLEGIRIRVDVLKRTDADSFDVIEVKSSTKVKPEHIPDVAIQLHVLEGLGIKVEQAGLLRIDNSYVYQGGSYDLEQLFRLEDVTEEAREFLGSTTPGALAEMWSVLNADSVPDVGIGSHCTTPYPCPFYGHCHQDEPEHPINQLPRIKAGVLKELDGSGIRDIREIPSGFAGLSGLQERVRDCVVSGQPYIGPGLGSELLGIKAPIHFLDFETFGPALPLYDSTRPYQTIPFQWSLHVLDSQDELHHQWFLHDDVSDPREAFVTGLLDAMAPQGSIVVYSPYEKTILNQLAQLFPEHEGSLTELVDRLFDLLPVIRDHCYHPEFRGSFSIKYVLPALVADMNYSSLEIQDGNAASFAFAQMIDPETEDPQRSEIAQALLDYCGQDTLAMVRLFQTLRSLSD